MRVLRLSSLMLLVIVFLQMPVRVGNAADQPTAVDVVFVDKSPQWKFNVFGVLQGLLSREITRQSLLIAARDELGLATRDAYLDDTMPRKPKVGQGPFVVVDGRGRSGVSIQRGGTPLKELLSFRLALEGDLLDYVAMVEQMEVHSRTDLADLLKAEGFQGAAQPPAAGSEFPETVEKSLSEMTFVRQFDALRQLHAAIRRDGQSPALLGGLVRGYANLGLLTEFHWHPAHLVFRARSLLYAQRLLASGSTSPAEALWYRAYALGLAGLHGRALDDLQRASAQSANEQSPKAPAWVKLIDAFCRYQSGKLQAPGAPEEQLAAMLKYASYDDVFAVGETAKDLNQRPQKATTICPFLGLILAIQAHSTDLRIPAVDGADRLGEAPWQPGVMQGHQFVDFPARAFPKFPSFPFDFLWASWTLRRAAARQEFKRRRSQKRSTGGLESLVTFLPTTALALTMLAPATLSLSTLAITAETMLAAAVLGTST